jgi:hypothetical protein
MQVACQPAYLPVNLGVWLGLVQKVPGNKGAPPHQTVPRSQKYSRFTDRSRQRDPCRRHRLSGMKAIVETSRDQDMVERRTKLLQEYRKELREWSRARLYNQSNTPEISRSMKRIEELEQMLRNWASQRYRSEHPALR